ncbi:C-C motif chemokine 27 [Leptodactylus fuscus]|uniref:C-C motif chemokine 27 n=1 Tax=Leptodactylus fuscus TaxID=238119 RepID=UPI003F4E89E3
MAARTPRVLVLLTLLLSSIRDAHQGLPSSTSSCCTKLAFHIPKNMLRRVTDVQLQKKDGICHIRAIVLHVNNQLKCMDPANRFLHQWVQKHWPKQQ